MKITKAAKFYEALKRGEYHYNTARLEEHPVGQLLHVIIDELKEDPDIKSIKSCSDLIKRKMPEAPKPLQRDIFSTHPLFTILNGIAWPPKDSKNDQSNICQLEIRQNPIKQTNPDHMQTIREYFSRKKEIKKITPNHLYSWFYPAWPLQSLLEAEFGELDPAIVIGDHLKRLFGEYSVVDHSSRSVLEKQEFNTLLSILVSIAGLCALNDNEIKSVSWLLGIDSSDDLAVVINHADQCADALYSAVINKIVDNDIDLNARSVEKIKEKIVLHGFKKGGFPINQLGSLLYLIQDGDESLDEDDVNDIIEKLSYARRNYFGGVLPLCEEDLIYIYSEAGFPEHTDWLLGLSAQLHIENEESGFSLYYAPNIDDPDSSLGLYNDSQIFSAYKHLILGARDDGFYELSSALLSIYIIQTTIYRGTLTPCWHELAKLIDSIAERRMHDHLRITLVWCSQYYKSRNYLLEYKKLHQFVEPNKHYEKIKFPVDAAKLYGIKTKADIEKAVESFLGKEVLSKLSTTAFDLLVEAHVMFADQQHRLLSGQSRNCATLIMSFILPIDYELKDALGVLVESPPYRSWKERMGHPVPKIGKLTLGNFVHFLKDSGQQGFPVDVFEELNNRTSLHLNKEILKTLTRWTNVRNDAAHGKRMRESVVFKLAEEFYDDGRLRDFICALRKLAER